MQTLLMIDDYILEKKLGSGSYGDVYFTTKKNSDLIFATKKIDKKRAMSRTQKTYFLNEINILKSTDHENIIKLHEIKNTEHNFYMIMEYCNGGSLMDNFNSYFLKHSKALPENHVQHILRQIASGLYYLHKCDIIHRDLKLENILLHYETEEDKVNINILNAKIKIIDFGFAKYLSESHLANSVCGSPINMDPIILEALAYNKPEEQIIYNEKVDIWSLGIIVYHLLIGRTPFTGYSYRDLYAKIDKGVYKIPKNLKLSKQAISLINSLLQFEIEERLGVDQLIYHEFLIKDEKEFEYYNLNLKDSKVDSGNLILNSKEDISKIWDLFKTDSNTNLSLIKSNLESMSIIKDEASYKLNTEREYIGFETVKSIFENDTNCNSNENYYNLNNYKNNEDKSRDNKNDFIKLKTENDISFYINNLINKRNNNDFQCDKNYVYNYKNDDNSNFSFNNNVGNCFNNNFNKNEDIYSKKSESNKDIFSFKRKDIYDFDYKLNPLCNFKNINSTSDYINSRNFNCDQNINYKHNLEFGHDYGKIKYNIDNIKDDFDNKLFLKKYDYFRKESEKLHDIINKMKSDLNKFDSKNHNDYISSNRNEDNKYSNINNKPYLNDVKRNYIDSNLYNNVNFNSRINEDIYINSRNNNLYSFGNRNIKDEKINYKDYRIFSDYNSNQNKFDNKNFNYLPDFKPY